MKITRMNEVIHHLNPSKVPWVSEIVIHTVNGEAIHTKDVYVEGLMIHGVRSGAMARLFMLPIDEMAWVDIDIDRAHEKFPKGSPSIFGMITAAQAER
jgi:hypothetical protein